jgi:hypothetical protein
MEVQGILQEAVESLIDTIEEKLCNVKESDIKYKNLRYNLDYLEELQNMLLENEGVTRLYYDLFSLECLLKGLTDPYKLKKIKERIDFLNCNFSYKGKDYDEEMKKFDECFF